MKPIKKRARQLLDEIRVTAERLALLTSGLSVMDDISVLADQVLAQLDSLAEELAGLKKAEFSVALHHSSAFAALIELADVDAISLLEERLYVAKQSPEDIVLHELLQQLVEKIEAGYAAMLSAIQQLMALMEEQD